MKEIFSLLVSHDEEAVALLERIELYRLKDSHFLVKSRADLGKDLSWLLGCVYRAGLQSQTSITAIFEEDLDVLEEDPT